MSVTVEVTFLISFAFSKRSWHMIFKLMVILFEFQIHWGLPFFFLQNNLDELFMLMHFLDAGKVCTAVIFIPSTFSSI